MFDTHLNTQPNMSFNMALRDACIQLLNARTQMELNSIPTDWRGVRFPAWLLMGIWYRGRFPTLSFVGIAGKVIDEEYDPFALVPSANLHWDPFNERRLPPEWAYDVWNWIGIQDNFATVNAVIALSISEDAPKAELLAALLVSMHLHDTSPETFEGGGHDLRIDLEFALGKTPKATWSHRYPHLIRRNILSQVALLRGGHAPTCGCAACALLAKRKAG